MDSSLAELEGFTYPSPNILDFTLEDNDLARFCPLDNGKHEINGQIGLGIFDKLPVELQITVLLNDIDLGNLTDFRRVNQSAMELVDSIPQYKAIILHASAALRTILSTGSGSWISCWDLYDKLCTAEGEKCGDFGGFLYTITCRRVCFICFTKTESFCHYCGVRRSDNLG